MGETFIVLGETILVLGETICAKLVMGETRYNPSVTFIKSVNQSSIKPCLSYPLCLKLAFIGVSTGGLVSNTVFDTRLSHLRLIENKSASKNISETASKKEK